MPRLLMACARIRRIGRVFSVLLLVWTTVDLIDHDISAGSTAGNPGAQRQQIGRPSAPPAPEAPHADHSFCCSHTVDVQTPFRIVLTFSVLGLALLEAPRLPSFDSDDLYHPPLA
jgi:hypothetical protein